MAPYPRRRLLILELSYVITKKHLGNNYRNRDTSDTPAGVADGVMVRAERPGSLPSGQAQLRQNRRRQGGLPRLR